VKLVDPLNSQALLDLPSFHLEAREFLRPLLRYLYDPSCYAAVTDVPHLKSTAFTAKEESDMLNYKFCRFAGIPRGSVYGFKVAQFFKKCTRPVWNCYIKSFFTDQLPHYHLQSQNGIAHNLFHVASRSAPTYFIQFDFKAYYDQFALAMAVAAFFCFLGRDGHTYALSRMPMGFTLACAIAQAATWQLLNFERRSSVFTCIDNVAFAGSADEVVHDVTLFLQRCATVSATLNELDSDQLSSFLSSSSDVQREMILSWHKDSFTFLGIAYVWSDKSKSLSEKSTEKLVATRQCLQSMTDFILPRQLAAIVGLLRYASYVLSFHSYQFYFTLDWVRNVSALLQSDVSLWDSVSVRLPAPHRQALLDWFDIVLAPTSVPIYDPAPTSPPTTLIVDASGDGWGAILYDGLSSSRFTSGRWPSEIPSSVVSEPAAVAEGAVHFFPDGAPPVVLVLSDHLPLVHASTSIAPRAPPYNALMHFLSVRFPSTRFIFGHIPGNLNPSDSLSRDGSSDAITLDVIRMVTGMGWVFALSAINSLKPCVSCSALSLPWQC
jgi:hypothetical protein